MDPYDAPGDITSPSDFRDPEHARQWSDGIEQRRPWRADFVAAFVEALDDYFVRPFTVAELGSGPGRLAAAILQNCDVTQYTAIDFSPAMHELAALAVGADAVRTRFVTADFRGDTWVEAIHGVDAVVTMMAVHEVRQKGRAPKVLEQVHAALKPAGVLLYCDPYVEAGADDRSAALYFDRTDQPKQLEAAGFVDVHLLLDEAGMALYAARKG